MIDINRFERYNNDKLIKTFLICRRAEERSGLHVKSTGIIRKVDELGRVVLPIEIRRTLDIAERDELEIFMDNDQIVLQKFEPSCIFCGSSKDMVSYRGKNVCRECIQKMGRA